MLLLLPEDIKVSPKMRPAKALSKRGGVKVRIRHVVRDTVARSLVRASCTHTPRHSNSPALRHTHTRSPAHPCTHTPAAITSVAQTKPARSVTRFHRELLCVCVRVLDLPRPPQVRAPAKGHRTRCECSNSCAVLDKLRLSAQLAAVLRQR